MKRRTGLMDKPMRETQVLYPGEMPAKFSFIDLFAGIGGMRIPFDELGGKCVMTSEIDKHALETYRHNFQDFEHSFVGDITQVQIEDIPSHDILLGGFPCQPFSHAGHKKGFEDTRGTLFFDIARILEAKRPKAFLLENVRGLMWHDSGNTFKRILEIGSQSYHVSHKVLDAKDFGLPQTRKRVYLVGLDKETFSKPFDFDSLESPAAALSVGDILESDAEESLTLSDRLWEGHKTRKKKHLELGNGFGYRMVNASSLYTPTLSARYFKDGSEILVEQIGQNPRKLTPREGARLQGFPESFILNASKMQAFRQLGNAVPISVVRAIAEKLVPELLAD
jgi:DNA (cytosine-5)-methyltransferase 1